MKKSKILLGPYGFPRDYVLYPENNSITSIDFHLNFWIKEFVVPNGITAINDYTFKECTSLQKVYIPKSVTYIGREAFNISSGFTEHDGLDIYYEGSQEEWADIDKVGDTGDDNYNEYDWWILDGWWPRITVHFNQTPADMDE